MCSWFNNTVRSSYSLVSIDGLSDEKWVRKAV